MYVLTQLTSRHHHNHLGRAILGVSVPERYGEFRQLGVYTYALTPTIMARLTAEAVRHVGSSGQLLRLALQFRQATSVITNSN